VFWSDEDEGFIATAPDLPGCSAFGESEAAAVSELDQAIDAWIDAARVAGNAVPAPSNPASRGPYSGKLLLRLPRSLHRDLVEEAKREDVSLNQFVVFVLSKFTALTARSENTTIPIAVTAVSNAHWSGPVSSSVITPSRTQSSAMPFGPTSTIACISNWAEKRADELTLYDERTKFMMDRVLALNLKTRDNHTAE
jgi:predicted RNase H-like HicB family nuclease